MKKEERLQQQCDVCGRLLDKNISNFRKYSRKTNGLNFHTTCRDCEDRIKLNTEWKDGKLLCHICGEYKEPSEFTYAGANKYTLRQNKECRCNSCKLEQRKAAIATYDNDVKLEKVLQARWLAAKSRAIDKSIPFTITKEDLLTVWKAQNGKCATRDRVEFFGLETNDNYANNQLVKEEDIQLSTFQYDFNIHVSITNSGLTSKSYDLVADVYIDGVPDGFITIPRSGTLDYQGATFFDRNFHFDLPTDLTNVSKLLFTGYFSTYRVTVDADSVTNNAICQSGVTTEIPINQAYIGGDTANISINVII